MICPKTVRLKFDPNKAKSGYFRDKVFLIIWCTVSYQHIRDQYGVAAGLQTWRGCKTSGDLSSEAIPVESSRV